MPKLIDRAGIVDLVFEDSAEPRGVSQRWAAADENPLEQDRFPLKSDLGTSGSFCSS
jgi:hypothetical protein